MSSARASLLALVASVAVAASLAVACDGGAGATATAGPSPERAGECATCHMPDYEHADPKHVGEKPTTCKVCHGQEAWRPSALHHDFSPLTGAHAKAPCSWCHKGTASALAVFKGTPTACVKCHLEDYDASTYPGHATFATTCADCHTTTAWRPSTFTPPPMKAPTPVATITTVAPLKTTTTPLKGTGARTPATGRATAPPPPPPPPPRVAPTSRPPDVISRPSRRH